ncbi:MAG: hypothetical protein HY301_12285 [Verrucomicrobia bacterium]|nr:hypothetical protein [Verrucomicrobiota bacterium]
MISRIGHLLLALALLGATGGHWWFLQSVAWTAMIVDQSRTAPLSVAVAKTFSGQHPCVLCKQIQAGKNSEQKTELPNPTIKFEFLYSTARPALFPPRIAVESAPAGFLPFPRGESPPVPPPRAV